MVSAGIEMMFVESLALAEADPPPVANAWLIKVDGALAETPTVTAIAG
jgi:hypothetical protein